jgi:hypothetical protein
MTTWANHQTWKVNTEYNHIFANYCGDKDFGSIEEIADTFKSLVEDLEYEKIPENCLAYDSLRVYLNEVDWEWIASNYAADFSLLNA